MKVALCFSGQPRYLNDAYDGIYENILEKYSPDVFVHTWWEESMANKKMDLSQTLSYGRSYYWEENTIDIIQKLYSPKKLFYQPQIEFETYQDVDYELLRPSHVHSMFYSIEESNKLKIQYENENRFVYDAVIRCRFDVKFNKFDIDFSEVDMGYINCPVHTTNFPNDQFAISSSKNIDIYSSTYSSLCEYKKSGWTEFVGERLLKHHLDSNNLRWNNPELNGKIDVNIIIK